MAPSPAPTAVPATSPLPASRVLVLNAGSSTLKYEVLEPVTGEVVVSGMVDRIGSSDGTPDHD